MNDFLSVIVPVRNAETTLTDQVERLLDVLPDLTGHFEVVLVDDGSTDQTVELARELTTEYPQLRLIRHAEHRGVVAAIKTGTQWAQGKTLLVQDSLASFSPAQLRRRLSLRKPDDSASRLPSSRNDGGHGVTRGSPHLSAFLNHLRNLTLGE